MMSALGGVFLLAVLTSCAANAGEEGDADGQEQITEAPMDNLEEQILGNWMSDETGNPQMEFADDGTLTGTDGCNGFRGDYTVEGEVATVKLGASTLKACQGVDDWLRGADTVTVEGDTMHVMDKNGEDIGTLERTDAAE